MSFAILSSFRSRILVLVLGLVTLVLTAMTIAIAVKGRTEVERQVGVQLQTAADTAREALKFRGSRLASAVDVLTTDFGFREAVASGDAPTLLSAVKNQRARINADLLIVLTPDGQPAASTLGTLSTKTLKDLKTLIDEDPDAETLQLYRLIDGRPYQLVVAPILAPETIGWAAMGFALDDAVATDMSRLLGVDVSFLAESEQESPYISTSLAPDRRRALVDVKAGPAAAPFMVSTGGESILTWTNPIRSANGHLTVVLQRSLESALRPYNDVKNSMFAIGALLLAVASALAVWLARTATRPIEALTEAAQRLEAGDYTVEVPPARTTELKGLARAFNAMRTAVADREATIRHQAEHEPSTGLPTRARISSILDSLLINKRPADGTISLCLIEIQQFESIIGSFGHSAGDEVLSEVARRLTAQGGALEHVGHIGTDRFVVLVESLDAQPSSVAAGIVDRLRGPFDFEGVSFHLEIRAGAVVYPADGGGAAELLQHADLALYRAKESGSTIGAYHQGDDDNHRKRLAVLGELRHAIATDELELHYQPKVAAGTGKPVGCEALVRWRHPVRGFIPPADFIPHAERTGAIRSLTQWVAETALRDLKRWQDAAIDIDVSINVSPVDLAEPGFADSIAALLMKTGAAANHLVLEVTESGAMNNLPATLRMMEQLRVLGIRFSIDDFGTGYSSLAHLKRLPVDEVKIDRSFIRELEANCDDDLIVRSTIDLGHALNLKVVAEGVEVSSSWEKLAQLGCDTVQGYFVSKPLPTKDFTTWMLARKASEPSRVAEDQVLSDDNHIPGNIRKSAG
jgi:diguanylate cyclase (GGDEF)-like protein